MAKSFKNKSTFKSNFPGPNDCILKMKVIDLDGNPWVIIDTQNSEGYTHDHMFHINKKIASKLSKYFKDLSKELE